MLLINAENARCSLVRLLVSPDAAARKGDHLYALGESLVSLVAHLLGRGDGLTEGGDGLGEEVLPHLGAPPRHEQARQQQGGGQRRFRGHERIGLLGASSRLWPVHGPVEHHRLVQHDLHLRGVSA